jgi:hypothetical protein
MSSILERICTDRPIGYVYAMPKKYFTQFNGFEFRSNVPVKPTACFTFQIEDLPNGIEVMPDEWASIKN